MMRRCLLVGAFLAVCPVIVGCGSSGVGTPPGENGPGETLTVGSLQVGVASAAGFRTEVLPSPGTVGFTAMYGSRILRLEELGYVRLAFSRMVSGRAQIHTINRDGSDVKQITNDSQSNWEPTWSPNAARLAFSSFRPAADYNIWTALANGTGQTNITTDSGRDECPDWSPDGLWIAYESEDPPTWDREIHIIRPNGKRDQALTENTVADQNPDWSPDSLKIAYDSANQIHVMNADGSGDMAVTTGGTYNIEPSWSPDGTMMAFASGRDANSEIYIMNADGSGQVRLTDHPADDRDPDWSPDGKWIAFTSDRGGVRSLYMIEWFGGGVRHITAVANDESSPAWCPQPSVNRALIGADGTDGGSNPPLGLTGPMAVVGVSPAGLVSAFTVMIGGGARNIKVAALLDVSTTLAGVKITANQIKDVIEDAGRGRAPKVWNVRGTPAVGAVLVFLDANTGKVTTVLGVGDEDFDAAGSAESLSGRIVLRGPFVWAADARAPADNRITQAASGVTLDARTGEVLSAN
jgi:dipeptidyl aminopeptidase/acylaminoacyl peptidase